MKHKQAKIFAQMRSSFERLISVCCIILTLEAQQPLVKIQNFTNHSATRLLELAVFVVLAAELQVFVCYLFPRTGEVS